MKIIKVIIISIVLITSSFASVLADITIKSETDIDMIPLQNVVCKRTEYINDFKYVIYNKIIDPSDEVMETTEIIDLEKESIIETNNLWDSCSEMTFDEIRSALRIDTANSDSNSQFSWTIETGILDNDRIICNIKCRGYFVNAIRVSNNNSADSLIHIFEFYVAGNLPGSEEFVNFQRHMESQLGYSYIFLIDILRNSNVMVEPLKDLYNYAKGICGIPMFNKYSIAESPSLLDERLSNESKSYEVIHIENVVTSLDFSQIPNSVFILSELDKDIQPSKK